MNNLNDIQKRLDKAASKIDLYDIANELNNRPEHMSIDKVTCLGFMDFDYAKKQVQLMLDFSKQEVK